MLYISAMFPQEVLINNILHGVAKLHIGPSPRHSTTPPHHHPHRHHRLSSTIQVRGRWFEPSHISVFAAISHTHQMPQFHRACQNHIESSQIATKILLASWETPNDFGQHIYSISGNDSANNSGTRFTAPHLRAKRIKVRAMIRATIHATIRARMRATSREQLGYMNWQNFPNKERYLILMHSQLHLQSKKWCPKTETNPEWHQKLSKYSPCTPEEHQMPSQRSKEII